MQSSEPSSPVEPQAPDRAPALLGRAFGDWLELPWPRHATALSLLAILALVRFWPLLSAPEAHIDEDLYEQAFRAVGEGRSPYSVRGYYYPTAFAYLGSWLTESLGTAATRGCLRALNVLALIGTLWLATAWWAGPTGSMARSREVRRAWLERLALAALLLVAAPGAFLGIHLGNLSFVAIGLALGGLGLAPQRPVAAGIALALSVALKPIAAAVLPLLILTPPRAQARAYRLSGWIGGALASTLWLTFPYFPELLDQKIERIGRIRTWSLYRLADVLHLDLGRLGILACLVSIAVLACSRARRHQAEWLAVTLTASVLTTPLIWSHTLLLVFPVLMMAASLARARWPHPEARISWAEPVFIALGWAVVLYYNAGAIDNLPLLVETFFLLVPPATLILLAAYVRAASSAPVRRTRAD